MNRTLFLGFFSASAMIVACGGKDDPEPQTAVNAQQQQQQWQQPQQGQQQQGWQQPQQGQQQPQQQAQQGWQQPTQPQTQQPQTQQPATTAPAGVTGTAQAIDASLAGAATQMLNVMAAKQAPGAVAEGQPLAGNFQAGQTLEGSFNLQPGKCYSVVGASLGPGTQVDAQIVITTVLPGLQFGANAAKGKASAAGSEVVLGGNTGGSKCVSTASLLPLTAKYVITMAKGSGMAAAQLFVK